MKSESAGELTRDVIEQLLDYNPETGAFVRKQSRRGYKCKKGDIAGTRMTNGYVAIAIENRKYLAHRLAWFLAYNEWPNCDIDHINRDKADNRIANLRLASRSENMLNAGLQRNNTSGVQGISFAKALGKWHVYIKKDGRRLHGGYYKALEAAIVARKELEAKHFPDFYRHEAA